MFGLFKETPDVAGDGQRAELLLDSQGRLRDQSRRKSTGLDLFEVITVSTIAKVLDPAKYVGATGAMISIEAANVRFRLDGTSSTTLVGHIAFNGDMIYLDSTDEIEKFSVIRDDAVDAVLTVSYTKAD
jgi:hypothetical protein